MNEPAPSGRPAVTISRERPASTWTIATAPPGAGTPDAYDDLARAILRTAAAGVAPVAPRPTGSADLVWIAPTGQVTRVDEDVPVPLDGGDPDRVGGRGDAPLITTALVAGRLGDAGGPVGDPDLTVQYSALIDEHEDGRVHVSDADITVTVYGDPWTGSHGPALRRCITDLLDALERLGGGEVTTGTSSVHPVIDRRGLGSPHDHGH